MNALADKKYEADNLGSVIYPDGKRVSYEYDKNDNITRLTDRGGRETSYEYDPLNSLTQVRRPDGTVSSYTYNARNKESCSDISAQPQAGPMT